jgi:hypothetical protein
MVWEDDRPPDPLDVYVQAHLTQMRAPLKQATVFGKAGRWVRHRTGERVILGPNGKPIRVVQYVDGGSAVEHGSDYRHAVARPVPHIIRIKQ